MTDNEIIKANDLCSKTPQQCKDCPFCKFDDCVRELAEETINLINRQKAEIERLNSPYEMQVEASKKLENSIKAYAIKEFAERLKEKAHRCDLSTDEHEYYSVGVFEIDNFVKEMVGEG